MKCVRLWFDKYMYRSTILFFCLFAVVCSSMKPSASVDWLKLDEVNTKLTKEQKPVLIDLYTDWCHWCKVMDKKTYTNQKVIGYISDHFYASRINAETRETLTWRNKSYTYNDNYRIHDFALYISGGQAAFPTTVIIPAENAEPIPVPGMLEPKDLEPILKYFGDGAYKSMSFAQFQKTFHSSW